MSNLTMLDFPISPSQVAGMSLFCFFCISNLKMPDLCEAQCQALKEYGWRFPGPKKLAIFAKIGNFCYSLALDFLLEIQCLAIFWTVLSLQQYFFGSLQCGTGFPYQT